MQHAREQRAQWRVQYKQLRKQADEEMRVRERQKREKNLYLNCYAREERAFGSFFMKIVPVVDSRLEPEELKWYHQFSLLIIFKGNKLFDYVFA